MFFQFIENFLATNNNNDVVTDNNNTLHAYEHNMNVAEEKLHSYFQLLGILFS